MCLSASSGADKEEGKGGRQVLVENVLLILIVCLLAIYACSLEKSLLHPLPVLLLGFLSFFVCLF